ncbi:MAG TPA: DUF4124 domain-containing protein [Wenzhouxiangella sp.]|nr:DUF4124 domain-containing protein [Wenzhouxiangella sp.]
MALFMKLLLAGLWFFATSVLAQPIYRVVDENGVVTYTDQKPTEDAKPLELPDLSVISGQAPEAAALIESEADDPSVEPFQMRIAEPSDGSNIVNSDGRLDIRFESNLDIPPAAQLVVFVNDQPQAPMREMVMSLTDLQPGEYRLQAELQTPSGRKLAESQAVVVQLLSAESG